jgi:hypothetical protein
MPRSRSLARQLPPETWDSDDTGMHAVLADESLFALLFAGLLIAITPRIP